MHRGAVVAGRFRVEGLVGSGGMGSVYRVLDTLTNAPAALKVMQREGADFAARFAREALVMTDLVHPGIVRYVAHGTNDEGKAYLALEWLDGEDLSTRLERAGLTVVEAVGLGRRVAEALAAAHARGVVHRDIKPSNIFLVGSDVRQVKILDFGIARLGTDRGRLTRTGAVVGTVAYMAPEQARGDRDVGPRADLYALGSVVFECIAGRTPFVGDHAVAVLAKLLVADAPHLSSVVPAVPRALDEIVGRLLERDPKARPESAEDVAAALASLEASLAARPDDLPRSSVAPRALTGREQRLTSVLIASAPTGVADGAMARTLTPEEDVPVATLRALAAPHGADLEQLADGSILVTLRPGGTPQDRAVRAARCALALRPRLPGAWMALATGSAEVASTTVGEAVDRAARLLRAGAAGAQRAAVILVDAATARMLEGRFELAAPAGGTGDRIAPVDGADAPRVLVGERTVGRPRRTLLGRATSFVGRARELRTLEAVLDESIEESVARAILVTGPPGIGKSRLVEELLVSIRKRPGPPLVWRGSADPITAGAPFAMLGDALRGAFGFSPGEEPALRLARIERAVGDTMSDADQARVRAFLAELVGLREVEHSDGQLHAARQDATLMGDQLRRAFEDFVTATAARRPLVLVLEDLHWGDLPTVRLVDAALRAAAKLPFVVVASARPEVDELFPRLWAERACLPLPLVELTPRVADKLVVEALGELADAKTAQSIVDHAAGNPLFLEELIRAVAEGRHGELPPTILGMLQARIEALPLGARRVLRAASIFGHTFPRAGVVALLGSRDTTQTEEWLALLVEREVVGRAEASAATLAGAGAAAESLGFRHALVREAAYAMLTDEDKRSGHRAAARWLVAAGGADAMVLASHFERGRDPVQAAFWYARAAEQALEGNDFDAVLERVRRAVACGAKGHQLGVLRLFEAEVHHWRGDSKAVSDCAEQALSGLEEGAPEWFRATRMLAQAKGHLGAVDGLLDAARRVERVTPTPAAVGAAVAARAFITDLLVTSGQLEEADRSIAAFASLDLSALPAHARAAVLIARSNRALITGDVAAFCDMREAAKLAYEEAGDLRNAASETGAGAYHEMLLGRYDRAVAGFRSLLAVAERMGLPRVRAMALHNLGLALGHLGEVEEGYAVELEALEALRAGGERRLECATLHYLTVLRVLAGDAKGAEAHARDALSVAGDVVPYRIEALAALAHALLADSRAAQAVDAAREAHALLERLGGIDEVEAFVRLVHVQALAAVGDEASARAAVQIARAKIEAQAAAIRDAEARAGFLERVPENAETLRLAKEWDAG